MSSESVEGIPAVTKSHSRSGSSALPPVLLVILAVAVLAGAFYYVGGVGYVQSLLGGSPAPGSVREAPAAAATATSSTPAAVSTTELQLPPGVTPDLAKRMYVEQIQSQVNLEKMTAGEVSRLEVTSVKQSQDAKNAAVYVKAFFADGSSAPGVIQLVKPDVAWYFMSFTGLSPATVSGEAETVNSGSVAQGKQSDAKVVADSGVTEFDYGVINTLLAEQTANQPLIIGVVDGSLSKIALGEPLTGAGTTTIPAELTGSRPTPLAGEVLMIHATVGQEKLTFLTSFRSK